MAQRNSRFLQNKWFVAVYAWADSYARTSLSFGSRHSTRSSPKDTNNAKIMRWLTLTDSL